MLLSNMNVLKKILILSLVAAFTISVCACGGSGSFVGKRVSGSEPEVGDVMTVHGVGELTLKKVHTAQKLYAAKMSGTYIRNDSDDKTYIDMVFRFKNKGEDIPCDNIGHISAKGVTTGEEYTDSVNAVEDSTNSNLHANVMISSGDTVTLHMAVSVPSVSADEKYKVKLILRASTYELEYTLGEYISDAKEIFDNQSLSNSNLKVGIKSVSYTGGLYDRAPFVPDCPEGMAYIIANLEITNKSLNDVLTHDSVSLRCIFLSEIYDCDYYTEQDGIYMPGGSIPGLGSANVIAIMCMPIEYTRSDARIAISIDYEEFFYTVSGGEHIANEIDNEREKEREKQRAMEEARKAAEELRKKEEERLKQEEELKAQQQAEQDGEVSEEKNNNNQPSDEEYQPSHTQE